MQRAAVLFLSALVFQVQPPKPATPASAANSASGARTPAAKAAIRLETTIPLPKVEGRIDHMARDRRHDRLFVAALGNGTLEVVDVATSRHVKSIPGLKEPQGVACLEEEVCVADGELGTLEVFDAVGLEKTRSVKVGADADNVRYDPRSRLVYVGVESGALAIVDAQTWRVVAKVALGGHPESFQFDAETKRAFVNVPAKRAIEVVDVELREVVASWPVREAGENFPMAIQGADRRLFVGCRQPPKLLVLDPRDGRTMDALDLAGDADDVFLDEASGRVYATCGEGYVDVFFRGETGAYEKGDRIATAPGARTGLYSPGEERLYLAVPRKGDQACEIRVYDARR
jgi:hypothetical protein